MFIAHKIIITSKINKSCWKLVKDLAHNHDLLLFLLYMICRLICQVFVKLSNFAHYKVQYLTYIEKFV